MKNWIVCQHKGVNPDPALSNNGLPINAPINLDLVETFSKYKDKGIEFRFQSYKPIIWKFIKEEARDSEYERISNKVKAAGRSKNSN
jgi:hypothetical protein